MMITPKFLPLAQTNPLKSRFLYPTASVNPLFVFLTGISNRTCSNLNSFFSPNLLLQSLFHFSAWQFHSFRCSGQNPYCYRWVPFYVPPHIQSISISFYLCFQIHQEADHSHPPTLLTQCRQYHFLLNYHSRILTCFP